MVAKKTYFKNECFSFNEKKIAKRRPKWSRLRESYLNRLGVKARLQNNGNRGRKEKAISMFT